jgi:hypothetical protein
MDEACAGQCCCIMKGLLDPHGEVQILSTIFPAFIACRYVFSFRSWDKVCADYHYIYQKILYLTAGTY